MASLGHNELLHCPQEDTAVILNVLSLSIHYRFMRTSHEITLRWMLQITFDDKSTLVQGTKPIHVPMFTLIYSFHMESLGRTELKSIYMYTWILYHCLILKTMHVNNIFLLENKALIILHGQYHNCWWPGDARNQSISSHDIELIFTDYHWRPCIDRCQITCD